MLSANGVRQPAVHVVKPVGVRLVTTSLAGFVGHAGFRVVVPPAAERDQVLQRRLVALGRLDRASGRRPAAGSASRRTR